jgi:hypothetical protein
MTTGTTDEESTTAAGGPGGVPLALRLSEGLGVLMPQRDEYATRALLERAAFAAELVVESWTTCGAAWVYSRDSRANKDGEFPIFKWAPRNDDGDALRLAVKLGIRVSCGNRFACCDWWAKDGVRLLDLQEPVIGGDKNAAIRQAIVRAAAQSLETPNVRANLTVKASVPFGAKEN